MTRTTVGPYQNITISGIAGTGSTTLLNLLREALAKEDWTGYSGGEYMRRFLPDLVEQEKAHHSAADYDESVDRQTDYSIREQLMTQQGLIVESWLSGFVAQGVPGVLKILLICTNELDRAQRLAERDHMTPAEAMLHAYERLEKNTNRWSQMYAQEWQDWVIQPGTLTEQTPVFFWHPNLYDLVLDTAVYGPEACLQLTLGQLHMDEFVAK
ncbi:MAG: AAA family ATPase [Anaerolineales bacterium]